MIEWKYKNKNYYFNHKKALGLIGIILVIPLIIAWTEGVSMIFPSDPIKLIVNISILIFIICIICKNCTNHY